MIEINENTNKVLKTKEQKGDFKKMATYYRGRPLADTKFIVHPHYATPQEASDEAIGHQVRHNIDYTYSTYLRFDCT